MYKVEKKKLKEQYEKLEAQEKKASQDRETIFNQLSEIEKLEEQRFELKLNKIANAFQIALDVTLFGLMVREMPLMLRVSPMWGNIAKETYVLMFGILTVLSLKDRIISQRKYNELATPELLVLEKKQDELELEADKLLDKKIDLEMSKGQVANAIQILESAEEMGLKDETGTIRYRTDMEVLYVDPIEAAGEIKNETSEKKLSKTYSKN